MFRKKYNQLLRRFTITHRTEIKALKKLDKAKTKVNKEGKLVWGHFDCTLKVEIKGELIVINPENHSFLNHPIIKERLKNIAKPNVGFLYTNESSKFSCNEKRMGISEDKYFRENIGVTYVSGISKKLYNENKMEL